MRAGNAGLTTGETSKLEAEDKEEEREDDDVPLVAPSAARKTLPPQSVDKNDAKQRAKESDAKKEKKEKKEKKDKKHPKHKKGQERQRRGARPNSMS